MDLEDWGVRGRVIEMPGHTPGSISIMLPGGEAIVGDVMMGGHMGGAFRPRLPRYHYFAEDLGVLRRSIRDVLGFSPASIFPGHGGPLAPQAVQRRFAKELAAIGV